MTPFTTLTGLVAPLDRPNVDTDQIIPKQFLKRVERTGFGEFLFYDWRYHEDGSVCPGFEVNAPQLAGASILVAGRNFGGGSSREHAPWALLDYGFRAILAQSFADIFYNNCFKNGILPVKLSEDVVRSIMQRAQAIPGYTATVDLVITTVSDDHGLNVTFEVDAFRRHCLLNGLDDIGLTLVHAQAIADFEADRPEWLRG